VTVDQPDEDPDDDRARAIIRAFWLKDIQGLRERHDQDRRNQNLPPITNKELAHKTGIPQSTLSDLLTHKRDIIPDWDRASLIIDCLGGTTKDWVPKWRTARAAYDGLGKPKSAPPDAGPPPPRPGKRKQRKWLVVSAAALLVVAVGIGVWLLIPDTNNDGPHPAAGVSDARCLRVRDETKDVSVFKDAVGDDKWTQWPGKTRFWAVGQTTHPNRWRVPLDNGHDGYVGKNPEYVVTANDCH
jgi:hypothetical protein